MTHCPDLQPLVVSWVVLGIARNTVEAVVYSLHTSLHLAGKLGRKKNRLKILYFIQEIKNIALYLEKYHKNELHLYLIGNSYTKLSQNMSLINTLTLIY